MGKWINWYMMIVGVGVGAAVLAVIDSGEQCLTTPEPRCTVVRYGILGMLALIFAIGAVSEIRRRRHPRD